jgi:hypothetical protein
VQQDPGVPGPDASWGYPAALAFRYIYNTFPAVTVSDMNNHDSALCTPRLAALGQEVMLNVGMGPDVQDGTHQHAHAVFAALLALFPPLTRYIAFPSPFSSVAAPGTQSGGGGSLMQISWRSGRFLPVIHATDCRSPMIIVTGAPVLPDSATTVAHKRNGAAGVGNALSPQVARSFYDFEAKPAARGLPAAAKIVRMALASRPCLPTTFPTSLFATRS